MNDDAQLIDGTLSGDTSAFGQLVTRYQDRLYNALVHVVGSRDEALDVTQDALVQAFLKLATFQRQSSFFTWLYRIAHNLAVSRQRRRKPTVSLDETRRATGEEPPGRDEAPGEALEQEERNDQVRAALARLSEEHRHILVLREMEGCCYETIAEILSLPVGTVRSRLHRARLQLRDQLKELAQADLP